MAHHGILRDYRFADGDVDDIRGATVYGLNEEKLGKIDDVIFDHATGDIDYVVVDTGGWLSSKKFIVPAERLRSSATHEDDFQVDLDKKQIEGFPAYNEKDVESPERWTDYENRYRSEWITGPVMHRAETDRNITPTTAQTTKGTGATGPRNWESGQNPTPSASVESAEVSSRIVPPTSGTVQMQSNAAGIGSRWLNFEERLRQRRKEITYACVTCGLEPKSETASERERRAS
jgi:sporulation protein YlmC with PRC-barrel domain